MSEVKTVNVTAHGETIVIRPMKVGQLPKVMRVIAPLYEQLKVMRDSALQAEAQGKSFVDGLDLYTLVAENADSILDLVSILTAKDRAWVEDLEIDELLTILSVVIEVNMELFVRRVIPLLTGMVVSATSQLKGEEQQTVESGQEQTQPQMNPYPQTLMYS